MRCIWAKKGKFFPLGATLPGHQPWTGPWSISFLSHHSTASRASAIWPTFFLFLGHDQNIHTTETGPLLKISLLELFFPQPSLELRGSHPFSEALLILSFSRKRLLTFSHCVFFVLSPLLTLTE